MELEVLTLANAQQRHRNRLEIQRRQSAIAEAKAWHDLCMARWHAMEREIALEETTKIASIKMLVFLLRKLAHMNPSPSSKSYRRTKQPGTGVGNDYFGNHT